MNSPLFVHSSLFVSFLVSLFSLLWGSPNGGLANGGLRCLSTIAYDCRTKVPLRKVPKGPQKCTIVDDCAQIAESGLKPPFESPHLDFPDFLAFLFFAFLRFLRSSPPQRTLPY